jgi:hypothetical protein
MRRRRLRINRFFSGVRLLCFCHLVLLVVRAAVFKLDLETHATR